MQNKQSVIKVSIAMATYNGGIYLEEQLSSFSQQTRMPNELIICDDGSTDNTVSIALSFAKQAPFEVKVFENTINLGYAQNFAKAMLLCSGDVILLSDQDDVWVEDKVSTLLRLMNGNPACQVIMNDALITDANLVSSGHSKRQQIFSAGLDDSNFVMGCCMGIKRRFVELALPVPCEYDAHDLWIAHLSDAIGVRLVLSEKLQFYRQHNKNESDFYVNSTNKMSRVSYLLHRLKARFKQPRRAMLTERKGQSCALSLRLQELLDSGNLTEYEQKHVSKAVKPVQLKCQHLNVRLEIVGQSRLTRMIPVLRLFANDGYSGSRRILSALGDVFLP